MSKENLEQFLNQVADTEELQGRIGEEIDAESLIALGAECGSEFTAQDLKESAELSDEELDGVAGGLLIIAAVKPQPPATVAGDTQIAPTAQSQGGRKFGTNTYGWATLRPAHLRIRVKL